MKNGRGSVALIVCLLLVIFAGQAHAQAVWGTSTATQPNDSGFEGYWKYCLDIGWDTGTSGPGMSHVSLLLGLESCTCVCDTGMFKFASPAGSGPGDPPGCTVYYYGSFWCEGDPTINEFDDSPTVKFEYEDGTGCEPGPTGTAQLCFYSWFPPTEQGTFYNVLGVKAGTDYVGLGNIVGVMPFCECGTPVEDCTWGAVKSLYR